MPDLAPGQTIEIVRSGLSEERADQVLRFWAEHGSFEGVAARERLAEVVCVLLGASGEVAGVNSVYAEAVPLISGRRFYVYRTLLLPEVADARDAMIAATFGALDEEFDPAADGPIGLCVPVSDRAEMERRPEPIWPELELMHAGYLPDGAQARIRYFWGAAIGPGLPNSPTLDETKAQSYPVEGRLRLVRFGESDEVTADDVLDLWAREQAVPDEEAQRRVHEVHLVGLDREDGPVGVSSAYLQRNAQLADGPPLLPGVRREGASDEHPRRLARGARP